jgi:hypothetical protein
MFPPTTGTFYYMADRITQKIYPGKVTISSNSPELKENNIEVSCKICDQIGGTVYDYKVGTFNSITSCYDVEFDIDATKMKLNYYRAIWKAVKNNIVIPLSTYVTYLEYSDTEKIEVELVPVPYFLDYSLRREVDTRLKAAIKNASDESIRSILWAGTSDLGKALKTTLYPKDRVQEKRDYYAEDYSDTFWLIQPFHRPLIKCTKYELMYADQKVMEIDPAKHLVVDTEMNTIEFLPSAIRGIEFYQQFVNAVTAIAGFSGAFNRIPAFFRVSYTSGIDFFNLDKTEQESYMHAICRHTMLYHLGRLDPNVYGGSISKSIDGASKSVSFSGMPWLQQQAGIHEIWLTETRRDLGTNWEIAVA